MKIKQKIKNGFTLIEVIASIGVITIVIIALLSTYYSIYNLQNNVMYNNLIQKKAETYFFTTISNIITPNHIYDTIKNLLNNDKDLKNFVKITEISVYQHPIPITHINLSKIDSNVKYIKNKKRIGIIIEYQI